MDLISFKVVIGCALKKEAGILREHLDWDCEFLVTGLGARRTEASLDEYFEIRRPSLFIFTGTAGQLDPDLKMGTVVFPETWCLEDGSCFSADRRAVEALRGKGLQIAGRGLTVPQPVVRKQSRHELHDRHQASICDMEAAFALKVAAHYGVPSVAPKVVSDVAGAALVSYWTNFDANMTKLGHYLNVLPQIWRA